MCVVLYERECVRGVCVLLYVCACGCVRVNVCERVSMSVCVWVCERFDVFVRVIFSGVYGMGGKNSTAMSSLAAASFPFPATGRALFSILVSKTFREK